MRTTGSTMSRFDKQRAVKSSGMPHSRRDNAVRGNPPTPTKIKMSRKGHFYFAFLFADLAKKYDNGARKCEYET